METLTPPARPTTPGRSPAGYGAVAGVLALASGLAAAELVAGLVEGTASPVVSVAEWIIDHAPKPLRDWAITTFGTADKAVLVVCVLGVLVAAAAAVGHLAVTHLRAALVVTGGVSLLGVLAASARPGSTAADLLPGLVAGATAAGVLALLARRVSRPAPATADPVGSDGPGPATADRRGFLTAALAVGAGAAIAGSTGRLLQRRFGAAASRAAIRLPRPVEPAPAAAADVGVVGVSPWVTPNADFYRIDIALLVPQVDPAGWTLRVHGLVDREVTLGYDDLLARPLVERWVTLQCVSNEVGGDLVGNARWLGVPLADVLREAGVRPEATQLLSRAPDGFTCSTPVAAVLDGRDALLAVGMNGEPLPLAHGFPVRLVVPGLYGYVSATKWVSEIELTTWDERAYWTKRGWDREAPTKLASRIEVPRPGLTLPAGATAVAGTAWSPHVGVDRVEVRVDFGPWQQARLVPVPSDDTWVQWWWEWPAEPGTHVLQVRAVDRTGAVQVEEVTRPFPDGATGYHTVRADIA